MLCRTLGVDGGVVLDRCFKSFGAGVLVVVGVDVATLFGVVVCRLRLVLFVCRPRVRPHGVVSFCADAATGLLLVVCVRALPLCR